MAFFILRKGGICLTDEARKIKNEYMKQWRAKNKDKVKATQERYWIKKANLKNTTLQE